MSDTELMKLDGMSLKEMTEEFQCPGCSTGSNTACGRYRLGKLTNSCESHSCGTYMAPGGLIALGLPKGFCKAGHKMDIRLFNNKNPHQGYDHLNVPVWAMEVNGFLFVRTYCPRINVTYVDVIENGTLALVPQAIDVSKFIDEID